MAHLDTVSDEQGELTSRRESLVVTIRYPLTRSVLNSQSDMCTSSKIGYDPAGVMRSIDHTSFSDASATTAKGLTRVMVCYILWPPAWPSSPSSVSSRGHGQLVLASMVAIVTFIVTLVAMICDFVTFSIVKHDINNNKSSKSVASWGPGIWLMLVLPSSRCSALASSSSPAAARARPTELLVQRRHGTMATPPLHPVADGACGGKSR